jgi:hypothetical protein
MSALETAESARPLSFPVGCARGATAFVWAVWALMLLAALGFVARYGNNVPFWDDEPRDHNHESV